MRLIIFSIVLMILIATSSLAAGIEINEIDVRVDYDEAYTYRLEKKSRIDSTTVPVSNGTKINVDVLPGSNVTFTIRVANTLSSQGPKLRDVFATITIEDINDGADVDEKSLDYELEPGDDIRTDIKFPIPLDVDSGTYNVVMEAEGEDRNGTSYAFKIIQKLEVKKQSHDIRIIGVSLNPGTVDCDRKSKLTAEIANAGSNEEAQIALEFKSASLGINSVDRNIFLESSDEASEEEKTYTKSLTIEIPSFFKSGNYPILINLYWKNFVLFDQKTTDLAVKDCGSSPAPSEPKAEPQGDLEEEAEISEKKPESNAEKNITQTRSFVATKEPKIWNYVAFIVLPALFIIIIVAALIFKTTTFK